MFRLMLLAGVGGFAGTCCRFLINRLFLGVWKAPFPLATFTINILGCFIFGLLMGFLGKNGIVSPKLNAFLIVGFCGGFTTFSTFSNEAFNLANNGGGFISVMYISLSVIVGIFALWIGLLLTK